MALRSLTLVLALQCSFGQFDSTIAGLQEAKDLVKCILNSDDNFAAFRDSMDPEGGYGCYCRIPEINDEYNFSDEAIDNVDRICKTYLNCLNLLLNVHPDCNSHTIESMPIKDYNPDDSSTCSFTNSDTFCDGISDLCTEQICLQCDRYKITDLKSALSGATPSADVTCG